MQLLGVEPKSNYVRTLFSSYLEFNLLEYHTNLALLI